MGDKAMKRILAGVSMALLIGGCVTSEPTRLDARFGDSVASMIEAQTYNPAAANDPESRPVMAMDGVKAQGNLEAYRRDVPNKPEVHDIRDLGIN
jgi:Flp pilus assembly protein TadD